MKTFPMSIFVAAVLALPGPAALRGQDSVDEAALAQAEDAVKAAKAEADRAQAEARAQMERTRVQLKEQMASKVPLPSHSPVPPGADFSYRLQNIITRAAGGGAPGRPLVIQTSEAEPKERANLEEDLAVMAHILDKAIEDLPGARWREPGPKAMGIDVLLGNGSGPMHNLYLDGYGALFLINVGFPLVPPASKAEEAKPSGDSAWEEAKQELYGEVPAARAGRLPAEEFSQDKVNKLQAAVLDALKNASNIRGLKPDESVTVCVLGGTSAGPVRAKRVARTGASAGGGYGGWVALSHPGQPTQGTVMTMRVKKADVDAYAKDKIGREEFQKRVRTASYATSVDSGDGEIGFGGGAGGGVR